MMNPCRLLPVTLVAVSITACSDDVTGPAYEPDIPTAWAAAVDNPFFPLVPGAIQTYESSTGDGLETTIVEVMAGTRNVNGVAATVVHDAVYLDGQLVEDTHDWYVQDADGNVWYVGEDSKSYENGVFVDNEGSWEWNVDGALPGIIMWADPTSHIGVDYRQEFYRGEAEDWAKVLSGGRTVTVPFGTFNGCIETEDWNGLESGPREHKFYCPGVGFVLETVENERVQLVDMTSGAASR